MMGPTAMKLEDVPVETHNDDGTITRLYALRLPEQTWHEIDAIAGRQEKTPIALVSEVMTQWAAAYVATWREFIKNEKQERLQRER